MGETRVDLMHLLEDLADAYPNALDETILTEIVANSLDSAATRISFVTDPAASTPPPGLVSDRGTAVRLRVQNALSPLLDPGFIERTLRVHFAPLFEAAFDDVLAPHYPSGIVFVVNARDIERGAETAGETAAIAVRLARKRKPSALGYLARHIAPLPDDERGLAISTLGKVIRRGWDWLGVTPASADVVNGLVEVPQLASCLTLNKADFLRSGPRGALFLAHRKALQEVVSAQLAAWGASSPSTEDRHRRATRPVERDVEHVLANLTDRYPMLAMLAHQRAGGRHKLPSGRGRNGTMDTHTLELLPATAGTDEPAPEASEPLPPSREVDQELEAEGQPPSAEPPAPREPAGGIGLPARRGPRRPVRLGLTIRFESREDVNELARLIENVVWVNDATPRIGGRPRRDPRDTT